VFHRLAVSFVCIQLHHLWHLTVMWWWACKLSKLLN
jgi:hypothetical protein